MKSIEGGKTISGPGRESKLRDTFHSKVSNWLPRCKDGKADMLHTCQEFYTFHISQSPMGQISKMF